MSVHELLYGDRCFLLTFAKKPSAFFDFKSLQLLHRMRLFQSFHIPRSLGCIINGQCNSASKQYVRKNGENQSEKTVRMIRYVVWNDKKPFRIWCSDSCQDCSTNQENHTCKSGHVSNVFVVSGLLRLFVQVIHQRQLVLTSSAIKAPVIVWVFERICCSLLKVLLLKDCLF